MHDIKLIFRNIIRFLEMRERSCDHPHRRDGVIDNHVGEHSFYAYSIMNINEIYELQ